MKKDKKIKIGKQIIQFDDIRKATEPDPEPPRKLEMTIPNGTAIIQSDEKKAEE